MTRIEHTNIIIDDFSIAKRQPNRVYTHILTHMHTDHLKGLHDGWNYGPIYCSPQTKNILLHRFPNLNNITTISINEPTNIRMSDTLQVQITFLNANHCVGAVIVLIQGYMGTVLYSGDMRFNRSIFQHYKALYPPDRINEDFQNCSKHVDVLYLDNTFLKKKFNFPPQPEVLRMAIDYIQQLLDLNKHHRIFIALDSLGKEEVLVAIATHFSMYIVVDEQRYQLIKAMGLDPQLFTTNREESFIEVVRKNKLYDCLKRTPLSIGIVLSGWVNHPTYRFDGQVYCLPYSLHSNYLELHDFVKSIKPTFIIPIVHAYPDQNKIYYAENREVSKRDLLFNQDLFDQQENNYNKQIQEIRRLYCSRPTQQYQMLLDNIQLQKKIAEQLLPPRLPDIFNSQRIMAPLHLQVVERKKYKIGVNRNEQQINRLKNQIQLKKKIFEGEQIAIVQDQDQDQQNYQNEMQSINHKQKHKKQIIDIDSDQEVKMNKKDVIQIDPLYQPFPITAKPKLYFNQKYTPHQVSEYNKQYEAKIIQQIKNKLKQSQLGASGIEKEQNKEITKDSQILNKPNPNKAQPLKSVEQRNYDNRKTINNSTKRVNIADINFSRLNEIKILTTKEEVQAHFETNPRDLQLLKQFLKKNPQRRRQLQ